MGKSKNSNFVQFDRGVMRQHRALIKKSALAAEVLTFLLEGMDNNNAVICSYRVLEEITGYSRRSLSRAVSILKKDKWIQSIKVGTANAYLVNSSAFWTTFNNGKQYSQFSATVIASETEQNTKGVKPEDVKLKKIAMYEKKEKPKPLKLKEAS